MSISYSLPQLASHFIAPISSYPDSPPSQTQYISHSFTSSTSLDDFQQSDPESMNRRTTRSSPSSTAGTKNVVSKAKKGKRVHACEYPGCTKIFTRAEHRRRHELSHKNKKSHTCTYIGCQKSFHRADYLAQHMARHGGEPNLPRKKQSSLTKSGPAAYSLPSPSLSQSYSSKSPIMHDFESVESSCNETSRTIGHPIMACLQCFNCQNNQQCQAHGVYYNHNSNSVNPCPLSVVSSARGPIATHGPNTPIFPAGFDFVIENYMRSMLRPEAFITPPQPLSSPAQGSEPMPPAFWDANIDLNLPPLDLTVFNNHAPFSTWPASNGDISPSIQTHQARQYPAAEPAF